jgi:hypothetical protein
MENTKNAHKSFDRRGSFKGRGHLSDLGVDGVMLL